MSIEFNDQQIYALYDIENWWEKQNEQVYELSGCSGSGKTTLIRYFIERIGLELSEVVFVAYMGKASMQMARKGLPAQTIHSLIYTYDRVLDLDENGKIQLNEHGKPKMKFKFTLKPKLNKNIKLIVADEASMISESIAKDLLSYKIPLIALGDLNQLPPVFGNPFFLNHPNFVLTKVMRQAEGDPIVWLSHRILNDESLDYGVYGKSSIIPKTNLNEFILNDADIVLSCTNKLRYEVNTIFRENIKNIKKLDFPNIGEKVICKKNNWSRCINDSIYLINGMTGVIDYIDMESFNGKGVKIDFKPDFINKKFKNVTLDYKRLFAKPGVDYSDLDPFNFTRDKFEFAYAITVHASQGSEWPNVVFLNEENGYGKDMLKKLQYTAITRAMNKVTIVI